MLEKGKASTEHIERELRPFVKSYRADKHDTQNFPGVNPSDRFVVNGGTFPASTILTSTGNLSVIDTIPAAVPNMYEVQTTYEIRQNGGSLITYLQASPDARFGVSGTYYAVELTNIVAGAGTCTATLAAWKSGEGAPRSATTIGCRDGMTLRMLFRENSIFVTQDGIGVLWLDDAAPIISGRAGVGALSSPAVTGSRERRSTTAKQRRQACQQCPEWPLSRIGWRCNGQESRMEPGPGCTCTIFFA